MVFVCVHAVQELTFDMDICLCRSFYTCLTSTNTMNLLSGWASSGLPCLLPTLQPAS